MQAKTLQENYQKRVNQLSKELARLGKEAEEIKARNDAAREAQQTIVTKQRELSYLAGEKDGLKQEWADAHFENDTQAIEEVESKKSELDTRTKELQVEIEQQQKTIQDNKVDLHKSTAVAVALDVLRTPDVFTYIKELERILQSERDELASAIKNARGMVPTNEQLYDDERAEVDSNWKSTARRMKERQEREDREAVLLDRATKGGTISL